MPEKPRDKESGARMEKELRRPLLPALIARRDGRDYLPISQAITQANRIFGPGKWRTEIRSHSAITDAKGLVIGYKCIVRVSVDDLGVCYEGVGFEQMTKRRNEDNPLQTAQAHDTAMKGAESDAVKRALRYFGDTFGNSLYEKDTERDAVFQFVSDAVQVEDMSRTEADRLVLGPFRRSKDLPISFALKAYYDQRERRAAAPRGDNDADEGSSSDEFAEQFPTIEDPPEETSDNGPDEADRATDDHDDRTARRPEGRDLFRDPAGGDPGAEPRERNEYD